MARYNRGKRMIGWRRKRRKFVYWQKPIEVYEISGCHRCKGHNCTYSEFVDRMWCFDCKREYKPSHWGIFEGPIPVNVTHMLGIYFHRVDIETQELIKEDDPRYSKAWP